MRVAVCSCARQGGHDSGRELLETLYRLETGQAMPEIRITPRGKPYFVDSPLHFSITHTDRHVFCALGHCNVGIDAEEADRIIRPTLLHRILSPTELARVAGSRNPNEAVLRLWVMKEADAKLSGEGLHGFPNHTDFSPDDPRVALWDGCFCALFREDENEGVTFHAF